MVRDIKENLVDHLLVIQKRVNEGKINLADQMLTGIIDEMNSSRVSVTCQAADRGEPENPPGYPGECPDGINWSEWLAMNNVD